MVNSLRSIPLSATFSIPRLDRRAASLARRLFSIRLEGTPRPNVPVSMMCMNAGWTPKRASAERYTPHRFHSRESQGVSSFCTSSNQFRNAGALPAPPPFTHGQRANQQHQTYVHDAREQHHRAPRAGAAGKLRTARVQCAERGHCESRAGRMIISHVFWPGEAGSPPHGIRADSGRRGGLQWLSKAHVACIFSPVAENAW